MSPIGSALVSIIKSEFDISACTSNQRQIFFLNWDCRIRNTSVASKRLSKTWQKTATKTNMLLTLLQRGIKCHVPLNPGVTGKKI